MPKFQDLEIQPASRFLLEGFWIWVFGVLFLRLRVGVGDVASGFKAEGVGLGFKTARFRSSGSRVQRRV